MSETYNLYNLEAPFKIFLLAENNSQVTMRNYLSDYRYFSSWLANSTKNSLTEVSSVDKNRIESYKQYLIHEQLPVKSINRRLSSLRKLFTFCVSQGWIKENPAKKVSNVSAILHPKNNHMEHHDNPILAHYRAHLEQQKTPDINSSIETIGDFINS